MEVTQKKRANHTVQQLAKLSTGKRHKIEDIGYFLTPSFLSPQQARKQDFKHCSPGLRWSRDRENRGDRQKAGVDVNNGAYLPPELSLGNNAWFRLQFTLPEGFARDTTALRFSAKGGTVSGMGPFEQPSVVEALCYKQGQSWGAFNRGHDFIKLSERPGNGNKYDLFVEVGTTLLWGGLDVDQFVLDAAELVELRPKVRQLHLEYKTFNALRKNLPEKSPNRRKTLKLLAEASNYIRLDFNGEQELVAGVKKAREVLRPLREMSSELSDFTLVTAGHAHIDAAWLWPWSETVRKSGRTFSTAVKLMKEYPEFRFVQSQPHLYEFVKKRYPELFSQVEKEIDRGNWEPVGGTWVEGDVNLSGGEALARQYLYGKRYFRDQFGIDPKITFIPDVFGYSASLPGIARAADCPYFFTQKMSWSEVNDFPHNSFFWEGIDGSKLISHFPPADTYNGMALGEPIEEVMKSAESFEEAESLDEAVYLIGWGDGGGGANRNMIEQVKTIDQINSLPDLEFGQLKDFFNRLEQQQDKLDKWVGELYLERHRGTLTTQGQTKRRNRKLEFSLREAEIWSAVALIRQQGYSYPREQLEWSWKTLLFHQFHDILPGSSIREVYEDAERDYGEALDKANGIIERSQGQFVDRGVEGQHFLVLNSLSWGMDRIVELTVSDIDVGEGVSVENRGGDPLPVQVSGLEDDTIIFEASDLPSLGGGKPFKMLTGTATERSATSEINISRDKMENSALRVELGDEGQITSIFDKQADREVLQDSGNRFVRYRDIPTEFEAWELEGDIYEVQERLPALTETKVVEQGPVRGTLKQVREFNDSRLIQYLIMYSRSKRIDFQTTVEWYEENTLLKVHFPVDVRSNEATYEIQYGHYNRPTHSNTSWDKARFEVPHQKWVDVSEYGYGAALLNDCKYGVNVDGTEIGLSLLRAPKSPDPEADMGTHEFTYSFLPHEGDFREAGVIKQSYDLNTAPKVQRTNEPQSVDPLLQVEDDGVIVEAVKQAEDSKNAVVIRLYEAWGRQVSTSLCLGFNAEDIIKVNLIEDEQDQLAFEKNEVQLSFSPFEIKSLKIIFE